MSAARRPRPAPPHDLRVTVVSGLDPLLVDDLVTAMLLRRDRLAVLRVDTAGDSDVAMHVHVAAGECISGLCPTVDECLTCTVREAVKNALASMVRRGDHDDVIVQLHPAVQPETLLRGLHRELPDGVVMDGHVAVLAADWLDVLAGENSLADLGIGLDADDDRSVATVLGAAIETADTLIVATAPIRYPEQAVDERATLDLLAPGAVQLRLRNVLDVPDADILATGRFDADLLDPLNDYGIRDHQCSLAHGTSLSLVHWSASRPLHPARLHAALDRLADGVIRSSGRLEVADQPDSIVGWDSAGDALQLGPIAPWQAETGARRSRLALLGDDLDAEHICSVLDGCLLDDVEMAIVTCDWDDIGEICPAPTSGEDAA